jgi:hypothetical protein
MFPFFARLPFHLPYHSTVNTGDWTCSHDTGHIWEEILPHPLETMSLILKGLERQSSSLS